MTRWMSLSRVTQLSMRVNCTVTKHADRQRNVSGTTGTASMSRVGCEPSVRGIQAQKLTGWVTCKGSSQPEAFNTVMPLSVITGRKRNSLPFERESKIGILGRVKRVIKGLRALGQIRNRILFGFFHFSGKKYWVVKHDEWKMSTDKSILEDFSWLLRNHAGR